MYTAILLIGPTGAGKTPLGQMLEQEGLGHKKCVHVDFGGLLRRAAAGNGPQTLTHSDVAFIRDVLRTGVLLEEEHFHIARKLLAPLLEAVDRGAGDIVVLNGLPRHAAQGGAVDEIFDIAVVVDRQRIRTNVGGDRGPRSDDDEQAVRDRLALFAERTRPLIDHYRRKGARIVTIDIGPTSTAEETWQVLNETL